MPKLRQENPACAKAVCVSRCESAVAFKCAKSHCSPTDAQVASQLSVFVATNHCAGSFGASGIFASSSGAPISWKSLSSSLVVNVIVVVRPVVVVDVSVSVGFADALVVVVVFGMVMVLVVFVKVVVV